MKYMLLIYTDESDEGEPPSMEAMQPWFDYTEALRDAGAFVSGDPLQPAATATTVRVRDGETLTTDGPFAETKEVLGGYYYIEVDALDEALRWAARCPAATYGSIEVRPIADMG